MTGEKIMFKLIYSDLIYQPQDIIADTVKYFAKRYAQRIFKSKGIETVKSEIARLFVNYYVDFIKHPEWTQYADISAKVSLIFQQEMADFYNEFKYRLAK